MEQNKVKSEEKTNKERRTPHQSAKRKNGGILLRESEMREKHAFATTDVF
jgi:hypothetical protein